MDPSLPFFSFKNFFESEGFIHGTSPRYYCPEPGHLQMLDPVSGLSPGECIGHGRVFLESLGLGPRCVNRLKQVHGDNVVRVGKEGVLEGQEGDALITNEPGCVLGILTADCVPLIVCDSETRSVGVVHAGRLGTLKSILEKTIFSMVEAFGTVPESLRVGMGPSIGPCCYEVEVDCAEPFQKSFADWESFVKPVNGGKVLLDLWEANRRQAIASGVPAAQVFNSGHCTVCRNDLWYSYRREGAGAGRMLTVAMWAE